MTIRPCRWASVAPLLALAVACARIEVASPDRDAGDDDGGDLGGDPDAGMPDDPTDPGAGDPLAGVHAPIVLLADPDQLLIVSVGAPSVVLVERAIDGLAEGEHVAAIDVRPSTGELLAVSGLGRLYRVDLVTGAATAMGEPFDPPLDGALVALDVDPVLDRARVVTSAGQSLSLDPATGAVVEVHPDLAYDPLDPRAGLAPVLASAAFTGSVLGSGGAALLAIDTSGDVLVRIAPASDASGTAALFTIGPLGADAGGLVGLDIAARSVGGPSLARDAAGPDVALAALAPAGGPPALHAIDLDTGEARALGPLGDGRAPRDLALIPPRAPLVHALTDRDVLVWFRAGAPGRPLGRVRLTGTEPGELVAIDARPSDGQLFGLGRSSRVYRIDLEGGAATPIGEAPFAPTLVGQAFGLAIDPLSGGARIVGDADQNLHVDLETGAAGADTPLTYAIVDPAAGQDPVAVAAAFTDGTVGVTRTTLLAIDAGRDALVRVGSPGGAPGAPTTGTLTTIGPLGIDAAATTGFDVAGLPGVAGDVALAAVDGDQASILHTVDLVTGAARAIGPIDTGEPGERIVALAIAPPPSPLLIAADQDGRLIRFRAAAPAAPLGEVVLSGLAPGDSIAALDVHPRTGDLVGLGRSGRLYRIDPDTGVARALGAPITPPLSTGDGVALDIDPVTDKARVLGAAGENLRVDLASGAVLSRGGGPAYDEGDPSAGLPARAVAAACTSSAAGASRTTLLAIDAAQDALVRLGSSGGAPTSPDTGLLFTIGSLGVDADARAALDVDPGGAAFAVLTPAGEAAAHLYAVDLGNGRLRDLGVIAAAAPITAATIVPDRADGSR